MGTPEEGARWNFTSHQMTNLKQFHNKFDILLKCAWNLSSVHGAKVWIWKLTNTHTGKVYFRRQRHKALSIVTERRWRARERRGLQQFYIFNICWRSVWFPWFCLAVAKIWSDVWTSVTGQLQFRLNGRPMLQLGYSSILFGKQRKIHPWGVRLGWPKRSKEKKAA